MIEAFDGDAEAALAQELQDFVAVRDVVFRVYPIIAFGVIVSKVVVLLFTCSLHHILLWVGNGLDFLGTLAEVVDLRKIKNFDFLVLSEDFCTKILEALGRSGRHC